MPTHIGLIIDGNRRWARKCGLPIREGHKHGAEKLEKIVTECSDLGVSHLTVYLLSTENLNRSKRELDVIFELLHKYLEKPDLFDRYSIRVRVLGNHEKLPPKLVEVADRITKNTAKNHKMALNLLVGYGGHFELTEAIKKIMEKATRAGRVRITSEDVEHNLFVPTAVDLIIRTGGMRRLSNFMPWQASYAEIYVTETLWPDFSKEELTESIEWFNSVKRNFGR